MRRKILSLFVLIIISGCAFPSQGAQSLTPDNPSQEIQPLEQSGLIQLPATEEISPEPEFVQPAEIPDPSATPLAPTPTPAATVEPGPLAPAQNPAAMNPLTGLPVEDPAALSYPPALVSITNFPVSARPQAGLSFSPFVFEMYVGEGMTRFLALFYGDYPQSGDENAISLADDRVGPVRSGRLPYESLRMLYNGFLVMASASPNVKSNLSSFTNIWGTDGGDINSALIPATKLKEIASQNPTRIEAEMLSGLRFDQTAPEDGKLAQKVWIPFNYLNQVIWRFDPASGAYHRFQDDADGETFIQATDRLNNQPLTYENVVILFANHDAERETLIDIELMYIDRLPALLFRDGKMYEIFWTTANGAYEKTTGKVRPIRFIDAEGNPFPLKPGQTWVEIVQMYTRYNETIDSEIYFDLKKKSSPGSGVWAIHFFPTVPER